MRYILKCLKRIGKPLGMAYLFTAAAAFFGLKENLASAADIAALLISVAAVFIIAAVSITVSEYDDYVRNNPDSNLIKNSFRGVSAKDRTFHKAVEEVRKGLFVQALDRLGEVAEYETSQREEALICFYKAECYRFMGYNTNAAMWYVKAIENDLNEDFIYVLAARSYTNASSFNQAMELYKTVEEKGFIYDSLYTDMGMCRLKAEEPDEALAYFDASVKTGRNVAFALGGCAIAYIMKKDVENSREFYKKALVSGLADIKGFIEYYRSAAEASGCTEKINEFSKLTFDSEDVKV